MKLSQRKGVTTTEAILILPLFLLMVFGLLQAVQIGIGLVVVNYGAGSIARKVGREATALTTASVPITNHQTDFAGLMIAGLNSKSLTGCYDTSNTDPNAVAKNVVVTAQAEIGAFPIIGPMLDKMAPNFKSTSWSPGCTEDPVPAVGFTGPPYKFIVRGMAVARRNYLQ